MDRLANRQIKKDQRDLLDWITPVDYATYHRDIVNRRQEGTGEWLLQSNQYRGWVSDTNGTFFCPGIPGAGKTMSAAIVVNDLHELFVQDDSIGIAYIYCNFRRQDEQKPIDLFASLLKQLAEQRSTIPQSLQHLYDDHQSKKTRPSLNEILRTLQSAIGEYTKAFIVVDALDECEILGGNRKKFITELLNMQAATAANLFATSRMIPEIEKDFEGRSTQIEIRASNEDLEKYLAGNLWKLPSFVSSNAGLQDEIKTSIIKAADGMYFCLSLIGTMSGD